MILCIKFRIAVFLLCILLCSQAAGAFRYLSEGMHCPDIAEEDISSLLSGDNKILVIVFWATWSKRSLEQLDDLHVFYDEYKDSGMSVIAINVDREDLNNDEMDSINEFFLLKGYNFKLIIDSGLKIFYRFGVIAVPSTAIVDSTGVLRYGPAGYSLTTQDRIFDSALVFLGLKERKSLAFEFQDGYVPDKRASRYYNLGLSLHLQGAVEQSLKNLHKSLSFDSLFANPYNLIGAILLNEGELDSSLIYFQKALMADSSSVSILTNYCRCLFALGDTIKAELMLDSVLQMDSHYIPAKIEKSRFLISTEQYQDALEILEQCEEINAINPQIYYLKGLIYKRSELPDKASAEFLKAYNLLLKNE
jgi:Flp pilus assembly protein TadD/peroxiredoxin